MEGVMEMEGKQVVIKIAALCGSLRNSSFHRGLIRYAMELCEKRIVEGLEIELLEISNLPPILKLTVSFRQQSRISGKRFWKLTRFSSPLLTPLKNAIDWASRPPNVWASKAAAIISTGGSLGGGRAQYHLRQIGVYLDLHFINKPEYFLRAFEPPQKFDGDGNLIDIEAKKRLKEVLEALQDFTLQLKPRR